MKRIEALCSINSGKYDVGRTYVVPDEEAASLEKAGLVKIVREVIDLRPDAGNTVLPEPRPSKGKKKRSQ